MIESHWLAMGGTFLSFWHNRT